MQTQKPFREVALFFALTLGLTDLVLWGPIAVLGIPAIGFTSDIRGPVWAIIMFILGGFVPSLVAIFLTWKTGGAANLRRFLKRVIDFRIGWRWYLAAVGAVALSVGGQALILAILGQRFNARLFLVQLPSAIPLIVLGPLSEELGWRGYAIDRLQTRLSALSSALITGALWAVWHLPLFFIAGTSQRELGLPFLGFFVGTTATSVLFSWLHNNTGGSIWSAVFLHWIYTYALQVVSSGVERTRAFNWLEYAPYLIVAILVVALFGPRYLNKRGTLPEYDRD